MKLFSRMLICCGSLGLALQGLCGCLRVAPKMSQPLASMAPISYSSKALDADVAQYQSAFASGTLDTAKTDRDQIVFRIMAQIDAAYGKFEMGLSTRRAGYQTGGDAAQLGLTAAATVVGASGLKDILAATSTALQGTRLSFDKNFFEQKTTEALISQMRASRKTLQSQILLSLASRDVKSYPLEAAWIDVVNYYYSGTIPSALVDIASKAGNADVKADADLKATVQMLTPATPEQAKKALTVQAAYSKLNTQIMSGNPLQVQAAGVTLSKILTAAGVPFDAGATPEAWLEDLKQAMMAAENDMAKQKEISDAVSAATSP